MKYFKVKNDIIKSDIDGNPCWTDEPLWLRNEIDQWKARYGEDIGGGRFFATEDAKYSYIISPNEDLMNLASDDLEELTEEEIIEVIAIAFPPQTIERDDEDDEIIPSPSLERVCSIFWKYATNHTGSINSETWAVSGNDHHITGNLTVNADQTLTIDPGVNVYQDGAFTITLTAGSAGKTILSAVGTPALPIVWEPNTLRTNTGTTTGINVINTTTNNSTYTLQYCRFTGYNAVFLSIANTTGFTFTVDHCIFRDIGNTAIICAAGMNNTLAVSNCRFLRSIAGFTGPTTGTGTVTITDCDFISTISAIAFQIAPAPNFLNMTDCHIDKRSQFRATSFPNSTNVLTRCLLEANQNITIAATATNTQTFTSCVIIGSPCSIAALAASAINYNNCDVMLTSSTTVYACTNASAACTFTGTSCYISGWRTADYNNYYTGSETPAQTSNTGGGTLTLTTGRTTRNFPFTAASITESAIGTNSVTIGWTGTFRASNRVRYGTVSGTYNMTVCEYGSWSNFDGKGQYSASPSIVLNNLKEGTTYYYVCEIYDPVLEAWNTSAEGTVATTGSAAPTFAGITGLEPIGFGALLASWSAATGTTTNYDIYIKIGSAPTFTEKPIKVDTTYTSFKITHLADGTRIQDTDNVYVSVRAENTPTLIDTNTAVLNLYPVGSGSTGVIVGDTVAIALKG